MIEVAVGPDARDDVLSRAAERFLLSPGREPLVNPSAYFFTVVRNCVYDHARQQARQRQRETSIEEITSSIPSATERSAEDVVLGNQEFNELLLKISSLAPSQRAVITMLYMEERSYSEVAELMKTSVSNVRRTAVRARKALSDMYKRSTETKSAPGGEA